MKRLLLWVVAASALLGLQVHASYDNFHFYRAGYFFGEPRFEKNGLTTIQLSIAGGSTRTSRNCQGETVSLFDIYGPANMRVLGNGVPGKDITTSADAALINLSQLPANDGFAMFSLPGRFSLMEVDFNVIQNMAHGLFAQLYVPVRRMNICSCGLVDICPSATPEWQDFKDHFAAILARYDLSMACIKRTNVGDTTVLVGWTRNYQDTKVLDYVDTTAKIGVIINNAPAKNEDLVFDIATGFDKHIGFPLSVDVSVGAFEWFTAGVHSGVIPFLKRSKCIRMKTDCNQSGLIKLAKGEAVVHPGPLWDVGGYLKADHLAGRLSFLFGYTFINQCAVLVCPVECQFDAIIVNSDAGLQGWRMDTINFIAENDFSNE
ncbi:MAG: hypothetical protein P4L31_08670, partial [Candidatus Babeliales bacterium]|nr:hypothetical protein [Candidatus Babeliales bacterium]